MCTQLTPVVADLTLFVQHVCVSFSWLTLGWFCLKCALVSLTDSSVDAQHGNAVRERREPGPRQGDRREPASPRDHQLRHQQLRREADPKGTQFTRAKIGRTFCPRIEEQKARVFGCPYLAFLSEVGAGRSEAWAQSNIGIRASGTRNERNGSVSFVQRFRSVGDPV